MCADVDPDHMKLARAAELLAAFIFGFVAGICFIAGILAGAGKIR